MQVQRIVSLAGLVCIALALPMRLLPAAPDRHWDQLMQAARAAVEDRQYAEAGELYTSAIHELEAAQVTDGRLAGSLLELGRVRNLQGRCQQASDLVLHGIRILDTQPQPDASEQGAAWQELGLAYNCQQQYSKEGHALRRALDFEQGASAPRNDRLVAILSEMGTVYQFEHRYVEAEAVFERAQSILDRDPRANPMEAALLLNNLGMLQRMMGRLSESDATLHRALGLLEATPAPDVGLQVALLYNLASLDFARKHYPDAAASFQRAVELLGKDTRLRPAERAQFLYDYAACLRRLGDKSKARNIETTAAALRNSQPEERNRRLVVDVTELSPSRQ